MKRTLHVLVVGSLALVPGIRAEEKNITSLANKGLNIVFVDTFEVMRNCEAGKKATDAIKEEQARMTQILQEEEQLVAKAMKDFSTKNNTPAVTSEWRDAEEKRIMNMRRNLENKAQQFREELEISMQKTSERIAKEVDEAVLALAGDYDAIVDKMTGRVICAKNERDITDKVMKKIDSKKPVAKPVTATKVTQSSVPAKTKNS